MMGKERFHKPFVVKAGLRASRPNREWNDHVLTCQSNKALHRHLQRVLPIRCIENTQVSPALKCLHHWLCCNEKSIENTRSHSICLPVDCYLVSSLAQCVQNSEQHLIFA